MKLRIGEYKQIDTRYENLTVLVDDYNEQGEIIGQHAEIITKAVPVMGMVYRDATPEEIAERERMQREMDEAEEGREPTAEERIHQLEEQNTMLLECLLEMSEIVYA